MRFDLADLRLFTAIVEAGSISRGAVAAGLAVPSASGRVSGMEAQLGVALLQRGRRGVTPTAAGRSLAEHARTITAQVERMRGDLRGFSTGIKGEIRLLSNTAAMAHLLPTALRVFLADHPGVDVDVDERISAEIAVAIADGYGDFGIVAGGTDLGRLHREILAADRLTLIAAPTHPLAARERVSFVELLRAPFVGLRAGALHDHLAVQAARLGARLCYRVRLNSFDAVANLVAAGIGVAVVPSAVVARASGTVAIALTDPWADRELVVCAPDFGRMTTHARLFVDELRRQARAI